jgi:hypothetical protein
MSAAWSSPGHGRIMAEPDMGADYLPAHGLAFSISQKRLPWLKVHAREERVAPASLCKGIAGRRTRNTSPEALSSCRRRTIVNSDTLPF